MTTTTAQQSDSTGTSVATRADLPVARAAGGVIPWDPFALMDRLDADTFIAEMQGLASDVLVYAIKDGKKEPTYGLSKGGVDECCTMLVSQGQCIREENLKVDYMGEGENREAIFTVTAARFAVHPDGREVRLDQVLGVKREPLFEARAPLTIDARVAGKKWRAKTYREALEIPEAVEYLEWIRDASTFDDDTKRFVTMILDGESVEEFALSKRFNTFWFEHGAMKAARNARFRLIPAGLKAQVMAMAKESAGAKVKVVERAETATTDAPRRDPVEDTKARLAENERKAREKEARVIPRREPDRVGYLFPFGDKRGTLLDAKHPAAHEKAGEYQIGDDLIRRAFAWADDILGGKPFARPGTEEKTPITDAERPKFDEMRSAMTDELDGRRVEREEAARERGKKIPGGDDDVGATPGAAPGASAPTDGSDELAPDSPPPPDAESEQLGY